MAPNVLRLRTNTLLNLAKTRIQLPLALTTALLTVFSAAQQTTPAGDAAATSQAAAASNSTILIVPAGSRIALVLTQPIQTRYVHRGDDIYAQIVSPVTAGNEVVIPPGTFVQGKVEKIERRGGRGEVPSLATRRKAPSSAQRWAERLARWPRSPCSSITFAIHVDNVSRRLHHSRCWADDLS